MQEVDQEFTVPTKFYIKKILKGEVKTKVLNDADVYKDQVIVNEQLLKKSEDYFVEHQLQHRVSELRVRREQKDLEKKDKTSKGHNTQLGESKSREERNLR